jgi:hypothetical protein
MRSNLPTSIERLYGREMAKCCNCAGCGEELLSMRYVEDYLRAVKVARGRPLNCPPPCAGRIADRPYCEKCLTSRPIEPLAANLTPRQAAKLH